MRIWRVVMFSKFPIGVIVYLAVYLPVQASDSVPKNLILFIGDGMGVAQVTAARIYQGGARDGQLHLDTFENVALIRTYAANSLVTDSGAAATALSTGHKTNYGMIGVDADGNRLATLFMSAAESNKWTGVVTTARITHATPAAFYANSLNRDDEADIALQLFSSEGVRLALGGGREFFLPESERDPVYGRPGSRPDGRNLVKEIIEKGVGYVDSAQEFDNLHETISRGSTPDRIIGLFNYSKMLYALQRENTRHPEPSLAEMTTFAIEYLSKGPDGFVLVVEGALIDHTGHENRAAGVVSELLSFDEAVGAALDHARTDGETLIVVTGDHETGGMAINGYAPLEVNGTRLLMESPGGGALEDIITFSTGPGHNRTRHEGRAKDSPFYAQPSAVYMEQAVHTGVDVPAWAFGPGSERIRGTLDNDQLGRILRGLLSLKQ